MTLLLYGALALAASPATRPPSWVWPVDPVTILRPFEAPPTPYAAGHRGIDLAGTSGQPVHAAGAGVVSFAGSVAGLGVVVVRHGELRTTYEPVRPTVVEGQAVAAGDLLGVLAAGHEGCAVCLHFGLRRGDVYLDPLTLFGRGPVRLLPLGLAPTPTAVVRALPAPPPAPPTDRGAAAGLAATALTAIGVGGVSSVSYGRRRRR